MIKNGLGDLIVINISTKQKFTSSGFQATAFKDSYDNIGILFRRTDLDFSEGGVRELLEADILEYFKSDSMQRKEALQYFYNNKSKSGNNYLYGFSLGGNLKILRSLLMNIKEVYSVRFKKSLMN